MHPIWVFVVISPISLAVGQQQAGRKQTPTIVNKAFNPEEAMISFTLDLSRVQLKSSSSPENFLCSPMSIVTVLNLLLMGSGGNTELQIRRSLHYPSGVSQRVLHSVYKDYVSRLLAEDRGVNISLANGFFVNKLLSLNPNYVERAKSFYNATIETLDFAGDEARSKRRINKYVEANTGGRIKNIITSSLSNQLLVVANAVYFKGLWNYPFNEDSTYGDEFFLEDGRRTNVTYMTAEFDVPYYENAEAGFRMIGLPYTGSPPDFGMFILLPERRKLDEIETTLTAQQILLALGGMSATNIVVTIPKMKMEESVDLAEMLKLLNVSDLFDANKSELSNMAENLFVSSALHRANIDVTEKGTELAAATILVKTRVGIRKNFKVNRPFIFFIRDNYSGAIFFWGRITKPKL